MLKPFAANGSAISECVLDLWKGVQIWYNCCNPSNCFFCVCCVQDMGTDNSRPCGVLLQWRLRHLHTHTYSGAEKCGWFVSTTEEVLHDAEVHAWPLPGQIWVVYEGWWRCLHQRWEAGEFPAQPQQQWGHLFRTDRDGSPRWTWKTGPRAWWKLLHGRSWGHHEQRGPQEDGPPHQRVPAGDVYHTWGRGGGPVCQEVCWRPVCLVLWGKNHFKFMSWFGNQWNISSQTENTLTCKPAAPELIFTSHGWIRRCHWPCRWYCLFVSR